MDNSSLKTDVKSCTPKWATKYDMPERAAYWLDQFARRGRPSISNLSVADILRLKEFRNAMVAAGQTITTRLITSILLHEYKFYVEDAQYIANQIVEGKIFSEVEGVAQ